MVSQLRGDDPQRKTHRCPADFDLLCSVNTSDELEHLFLKSVCKLLSLLSIRFLLIISIVTIKNPKGFNFVLFNMFLQLTITISSLYFLYFFLTGLNLLKLDDFRLSYLEQRLYFFDLQYQILVWSVEFYIFGILYVCFQSIESVFDMSIIIMFN